MMRFCGSRLGRHVTIMVGLPLFGIQSPFLGSWGPLYVLVAKGVHGTPKGAEIKE